MHWPDWTAVGPVTGDPHRIVWTMADRLAGRRLPPHTRLVTRASRWGNPYPVCPHRTQRQAVEAFALLLATRVDDPARWCDCMPARIAGRRRTPANTDDPPSQLLLAGWRRPATRLEAP